MRPVDPGSGSAPQGAPENSWIRGKRHRRAFPRYSLRRRGRLHARNGMLLKVIAMLDVVLLAIGVGFFSASVLYVLACERMW